jgi:hypothetical protein
MTTKVVHIVTTGPAIVRTVWTYRVPEDTEIPDDDSDESIEFMENMMREWVAVDLEEEVIDVTDEPEIHAWDSPDDDIDVETDGL